MLDYWTVVKGNQDLPNPGHGKYGNHSSKLSDDLFQSKIKHKDSREDFLPLSRGNTLLEESNVSSSPLRSSMKTASSNQISGSDHLRGSARTGSEIGDASYVNEENYNIGSQNEEFKWYSTKDSSDFGLKPKKYLDNKFDLDNGNLHSEFNGASISDSIIKNRKNVDNLRKTNLSPVVSKPLEFDRKCAWDIQWAAVSILL